MTLAECHMAINRQTPQFCKVRVCEVSHISLPSASLSSSHSYHERRERQIFRLGEQRRSLRKQKQEAQSSCFRWKFLIASKHSCFNRIILRKQLWDKLYVICPMILEIFWTQRWERKRVSKRCESPKFPLDQDIQAIFFFLRFSAFLILIVSIKAHERSPIFIILWAGFFPGSHIH